MPCLAPSYLYSPCPKQEEFKSFFPTNSMACTPNSIIMKSIPHQPYLWSSNMKTSLPWIYPRSLRVFNPSVPFIAWMEIAIKSFSESDSCSVCEIMESSVLLEHLKQLCNWTMHSRNLPKTLKIVLQQLCIWLMHFGKLGIWWTKLGIFA